MPTNQQPEFKISSQVYLRRLNAQELGFRNEKPGQAGRYFYISKSSISYFPPLSQTVINDHVFIDIIPPNSSQVVLTNYVYHNDKYAGTGTRDEYRIYLNTGNDPGRDFFKPGDIILIVRLEFFDNLVYKIIHFPITKDDDFIILDSLLNQKDQKYQSHAFVQLEDVNFLHLKDRIEIGEKIIPKEIIEESLNEPIQAPIQRDDPTSITPIIRSNTFRDLVLFFYNFRCAITDKEAVISYKDVNNLEAAHILARASGGGSNPANGLALERNLHWAFDKGFFTVTTDYKIKVHPAAVDIGYLKDRDGTSIYIPEDSRVRPNKEALEWHNKNVFGLFLRMQI